MLHNYFGYNILMTHIRNRQYTHEELQNLKGLDQMEHEVAFNSHSGGDWWSEEDYTDSYNKIAKIYNTLGLKQFPILTQPMSSRTYAKGLLYFRKKLKNEIAKYENYWNPKPAIKRKFKKLTGKSYNLDWGGVGMDLQEDDRVKEKVDKILFHRNL